MLGKGKEVLMFQQGSGWALRVHPAMAALAPALVASLEEMSTSSANLPQTLKIEASRMKIVLVKRNVGMGFNGRKIVGEMVNHYPFLLFFEESIKKTSDVGAIAPLLPWCSGASMNF